MRSGVDEGGTLVAGTRFDTGRGFYWSPTLIAGCHNGMKATREEIFGPVVVAIPFDDEEEGIAIANDSAYGLYDYVDPRHSQGHAGLAAPARQRRPQHAGPQPGDAVRRVPQEWHWARRWVVRLARLQRAAEHRLAWLRKR